MATLAPNSQAPIHTLTWADAQRLARSLAARLPVAPIYGIPRGGSFVSAFLAHRFQVLDAPSPGCSVVDDIIDSGRTLARYAERGFYVDALMRSPRAPAGLAPRADATDGGWIVFPWELGDGAQGPEDAVVRLLEFIGEDPRRDGLRDTPRRVLAAWKDMTRGYREDPAVILERRFELPHDEMIVLSGARFTSICEHHLMVFSGTASVGYVPGKDGLVVGLSKLARLVHAFAARLQIQERMTDQIADALELALKPQGVAVIIRGRHSCMGHRGAREPDALMTTSAMRGVFRQHGEARGEFLALERG